MRDPRLLGGPFQAPSFWTWFCVAKLLSGEPLDKREAELFRQCTGRTKLPEGSVKHLAFLSGRRSGKDRFMSAVAIYRAALAANGWNASEWQRAGISYRPSQLTKSDLYLACLPMLLSGQVRLLDNEKMRQQFVGLVRKVHSGGRESVDDSGAASANDDLSNCCSGAMVMAAKVKAPMTFAAPDVVSHPRPPVPGGLVRGEFANFLGLDGGVPPGGLPNPVNAERRGEPQPQAPAEPVRPFKLSELGSIYGGRR
jgi:hypothetical protein